MLGPVLILGLPIHFPEIVGDWDSLVLEQLYVPQFCRDLANGVDNTVSHQHVDIFPRGTQCIPSRVFDGLTVHGLWPNYRNGYPACCRGAESTELEGLINLPLDPIAFPATYPSFTSSLDEAWRDPTAPDAHTSLCGLLNHELQKHGYCLGYKIDLQDASETALHYFTYTLAVAQRLGGADAMIAGWARDGLRPSVSAIEGLYAHQVRPLGTP